MRKSDQRVSLPRGERLRDSRRQATSMSLPLAVHHRLDLLAEAAADVNASRGEIIAMLIAEADPDPAELERRVLAFRKMTVGEVLPAQERVAEGDQVVVPLRTPGRPKRSA